MVERYQRKVYAVAFGMLKDREEARDVTQEAFVKVYKYLDHFKGDASFYTWLYRITSNVCIDVMRRKGSSKGEQVEFDETVAHETSASPSPTDSSPSRRESRVSFSLRRVSSTGCV